jgi:hypothetical protein
VTEAPDSDAGEEELTTFYGVVGRAVSGWHFDMLNEEVKLRWVFEVLWLSSYDLDGGKKN